MKAISVSVFVIITLSLLNTFNALSQVESGVIFNKAQTESAMLDEEFSYYLSNTKAALANSNHEGNYLILNQNGDGHKAVINQKGKGNNSYLEQKGSGHTYELSMTGHHNTSIGIQKGANNVMIDKVSGNNVEHIITQQGSGHVFIEEGKSGIPLSIHQKGKDMKIILR
jgi:hypothetical protein